MVLRKQTGLIITALALSGCLESSSYITPDKSDAVAKFILNEPPKRIKNSANVAMEDSIVFLGYDVDKETAAPGEKVRVTWYWQCKKAPGPGWRLFTHVFDGAGKSRINKDNEGRVRGSFQPEHWKEGIVVRDVQEIAVPKNWNSDVLELRAGLWKGNTRMAAKGSGTDSSSRVLGPKIKVEAKKPRPLAVKIPRAEVAPKIDGKFDDEKAWENAAKIESFKNTMTGKESSCGTTVKLLWDDNNLYVAMHSPDDFLSSKFEKNDDELWKEDAFEIFLDPLGDEKDYYELQASPAGIVFDSYLPKHRENHNDWTSDMKVKVSLEGKLNDPSDEDKGWSAELAIPFASLNQAGGAPPKAGDKWRGNFFRVDLGKTKTDYCTWSPPLRGDFHALDRFGELIFKGDQPAAIAPSADAVADPKAEQANIPDKEEAPAPVKTKGEGKKNAKQR